MTHEHEWGAVERSPLAGERFRQCRRCGSTTTDPSIVDPPQSDIAEGQPNPSDSDESRSAS